MARLPIPSGDNNNWGTLLNTYLLVSHDADGDLEPEAIATASRLVSVQAGAYGPSADIGEIVLVNAASGPVTITLPTAASNNHMYTIKKIDSSSNDVTVTTTSSQTIDGGLTALLRVRYVSVTLVSDGSNWSVI